MLFVKLPLDVLDNAELRRAARTGAKHLWLLPWVLAFAKKADDDGRLTVGGVAAEPVDIAESIVVANPRQVERGLSELEAIQWLARDADNVLRVADWNRQAGKPSDAPSAIAERVRRHRERRQTAEHTDVTPGNALHVTPDNATEREREKEREYRARAESEIPTTHATAWLSLAREVPPAAQALLEILPGERRQSVQREMVLVLSTGCAFKSAVVRATPERLEAKCRETLAAYDRGKVADVWPYTLMKLADTSDGSAPGAVAAKREAADRASDEVEAAQRGRAHEEWLRANPDEQARLTREAAEAIPGDGLAAITSREAWLMSAARRLMNNHSTEAA